MTYSFEGFSDSALVCICVYHRCVGAGVFEKITDVGYRNSLLVHRHGYAVLEEIKTFGFLPAFDCGGDAAGWCRSVNNHDMAEAQDRSDYSQVHGRRHEDEGRGTAQIAYVRRIEACQTL